MTYYIGIDTETSGLDPAKHGICEIGAVATNDKGQVVDIYQAYCRPTRDLLVTSRDHSYCTAVLDPNALEVNGLTRRFIENQAPDFMVMPTFAEWLKGFTVKADSKNGTDEVRKVFCNAPFDLGFLNALARRAGCFEDFEQGSYRCIDLWSIGHAVLPNAPVLSLNKTCETLGIENRVAHSAVSDALATVNGYHELMRRRKALDYQDWIRRQVGPLNLSLGGFPGMRGAF